MSDMAVPDWFETDELGVTEMFPDGIETEMAGEPLAMAGHKIGGLPVADGKLVLLLTFAVSCRNPDCDKHHELPPIALTTGLAQRLVRNLQRVTEGDVAEQWRDRLL